MEVHNNNLVTQETTILVVDDEPENLKVVGEILKRANLNFIFSTSGEEALEAVHTQKPTLILLDIMMPGHSGLDICRMLKKDTEVSSIPVIFLTAKAERENIVEGLRAGGVDYLVKPFRAEELVARVQLHLELYQSRMQTKALYERKKELISMLAHGVKNPAGAIYSIARSLILDIKNNEADLEEIGSFLELIDASATGLAELVEKTLNQEKIDESEMTGAIVEETSVSEVIDYLITLNSVHARKRQIELQYEPVYEPLVHIDRRTLIEIMDNIITNAVKYSKKNTAVNIKLMPSAERLDYWRIEVADTGAIIPKADRERLFKKYIKTGSTVGNTESSHGVGLSIVKRLVDECDGKIGSLERSDGKGNVFFVELPFEF